MFFGSEQRQRSRCFDLLREDTARALRVVQVAQRAGDLAGCLLSINDDTYVPNIRSGRAYTPQEYRHKRHATAVLPVTMHEARHTTRMIQPITEDYLRPRLVPRALFFRGLNRQMTRQELIRRWGQHQELRASGPPHRDAQEFDNPYAATIRVGARLSPNGRQTQISQPVEIVLQDRMHSFWQRAIAGAHMHNHVDDILHMGAMSVLPENAAMSELHSNEVTQIMIDTFGLEMPESIDNIAALLSQYESTSYPFIYNPRLAEAIEQKGLRLPHCTL